MARRVAPSLVTCPTSSTAIRSRLGDPHDPVGDLADLRDGSRGARQLGAVERLHRVDHAHLGPLLLERREHGLEIGLRDHRDPRARRLRAAAGPAAGSAPPTPPPRRRESGGPRRTRWRAPSSSASTCRSPESRRSGPTSPGTIPPPRTLSSSPIPVLSRRWSSARTSRSATGRTAAARAGRLLPRPAPRRRHPDLLDERVPLAAARAAPGPTGGLVTAFRADMNGRGSSHRTPSVRPAPDGSANRHTIVAATPSRRARPDRPDRTARCRARRRRCWSRLRPRRRPASASAPAR